MSDRVDPDAPKFGLPQSLWIPIAATSEAAIGQFVGKIIETRRGSDGSPKALLVRSHSDAPEFEPATPLWSARRDAGLPKHPTAEEAKARLHPSTQCWVHVDYSAYRSAYFALGLSAPSGYFLDHVQNRKAIRFRDRSHPWLRLCPVSRGVNTSGGSIAGGEGMEKAFLAGRGSPLAATHQIIYADPMDLTKMLDLEPGTGNLDGVRVTQALFYPK
jgi:hypothetical protein